MPKMAEKDNDIAFTTGGSAVFGNFGRLGFEMDFFTVTADDHGRCADHRAVIGNIDHINESVGADTGIVADYDRAKEGCAGTNEHIIAEGGVTFADMFAGAAQCDIMIQHTIVADYGRLADDDSGAVVDKQPRTDSDAGVDFDTGEETVELRKKTRNKRQL